MNLRPVIDAAVAFVTAFEDDEDEALTEAVLALPRAPSRRDLAALAPAEQRVVRAVLAMLTGPRPTDAQAVARSAELDAAVAALQASRAPEAAGARS
jgi:hypothetical protein